MNTLKEAKNINCQKSFLRSIVQICAFVFLVSFLILSATSCADKPLMGEKNTSGKVTAVIYDLDSEDRENFGGIVYRKILNTDKLLAYSKTPLLLAFIDDSTYSRAALPFIETLADNQAEKLLIVKIDVEAAENPVEVLKLLQLYDIDEFPFFVLLKSSVKKGVIVGFDDLIKTKIINLIERNLD